MKRLIVLVILWVVVLLTGCSSARIVGGWSNPDNYLNGLKSLSPVPVEFVVGGKLLVFDSSQTVGRFLLAFIVVENKISDVQKEYVLAHEIQHAVCWKSGCVCMKGNDIKTLILREFHAYEFAFKQLMKDVRVEAVQVGYLDIQSHYNYFEERGDIKFSRSLRNGFAAKQIYEESGEEIKIWLVEHDDN